MFFSLLHGREEKTASNDNNIYLYHKEIKALKTLFLKLINKP